MTAVWAWAVWLSVAMLGGCVLALGGCVAAEVAWWWRGRVNARAEAEELRQFRRAWLIDAPILVAYEGVLSRRDVARLKRQWRAKYCPPGCKVPPMVLDPAAPGYHDAGGHLVEPHSDWDALAAPRVFPGSARGEWWS